MTQPVFRYQAGPCVASVFENTSNEPDAKPYSRVVLQRIYRDAQGKYHGTTGLRMWDVPLAIWALLKAYDYLVTNQRKTKEAFK